MRRSIHLISCLLLALNGFGVEELEELVVTAPDDLDLMRVDLVADVTVIDRATIEKSGAVSVPELLEREANVLIRSATGNGLDGQISMRGFGENSQLRSLVLVDGHRMNRPDMAGINWLEVPPSSIERVEVIRGGQNVLYGDRAVGGVVKITTKRGAAAGARLGGGVGSFGYLGGDVGFGGSAGPVDVYAGASGFEQDGFRSNSAARAVSASANLAWFAGDGDVLTARASIVDAKQQYPGPISYEDMRQDPTRSDSDGAEGAENRSALATLIWEGERDWGAARVASGMNYRDTRWHIVGRHAENEMWGASLGPRARLGSKDSFIMGGVDGFYDVVDFKDLHPSDQAYARARADVDRFTLAPYVFAQKKINRAYALSGGARYETARTDTRYVDYVDDQVLPYDEWVGIGTFPNPNHKNPPDADPTNSYAGVITKDGCAVEVSLAREWNESDAVWIGYDRLYRYPTLDEVASYQGYPLSDPLNEKLEPETGDQFELGARFAEGRWGGALTAFLLLMDNEIAFVDAPPVRLNMNIGSTRRVGAEAELRHARRTWGVSTRWSLVDARFRGGEYDGNTVPLAPWAYGVLNGWIDPADFVRLSAAFRYVSSQVQGGDEDNALRRVDAYGLLDLRANVEMNSRAELVISMNNVFDQVHATSAYNNGFYPGAGRNFRVMLNVRF